MIANILTTLVGLWLVYRAIFSAPPGEMNVIELAVAGVVVVMLAAWARRSDYAHWQSGTNIVLGAVLFVLAVLRWTIAVAPLVSFWFILLGGIAIGIVAMWSMLYRPNTAAAS